MSNFLSVRTIFKNWVVEDRFYFKGVCLCFVVIFISQMGLAQTNEDRCRQSLQVKDDKANLVDSSSTPEWRRNPGIDKLFESQYSDIRSVDYQFLITQKPEEQIEKVRSAFQKNGIDFSEGQDRRFFGLVKSTKLIVAPNPQGAILNQLANHLYQRMGVTLTYNPRALFDGSTAFYLPSLNEIGIPHAVALSGNPNISVFHEIRHAALANKSRKGTPSLYEATAVKTDKEIPSNHPYDDYLTFQEISTYFQDANFAYHASLSPRVLELSWAEQRRFFNRVADSLRHSKSILEFAGRRLDHAVKIINGGAGKIIVAQKAGQSLRMTLYDRSYDFSFNFGLVAAPSKAEERQFLLNHIEEIKAAQQKKLERLDSMKSETAKRLAHVNHKILNDQSP
jgi:hypothetical protein